MHPWSCLGSIGHVLPTNLIDHSKLRICKEIKPGWSNGFPGFPYFLDLVSSKMRMGVGNRFPIKRGLNAIGWMVLLPRKMVWLPATSQWKVGILSSKETGRAWGGCYLVWLLHKDGEFVLKGMKTEILPVSLDRWISDQKRKLVPSFSCLNTCDIKSLFLLFHVFISETICLFAGNFQP